MKLNQPNNTNIRSFTAKQQAFIDQYCSAAVNCNATEAARRAGYRGNENTLGTVGNQNMQKPAIRREIDKRLKDAIAGTTVTIQKILWELQVTYERASEAGKYSAAVRCLELQGKYLKMFSDRIEHVQTLDSMSMEDLVKLLHEIADNGNIELTSLLQKPN